MPAFPLHCLHLLQGDQLRGHPANPIEKSTSGLATTLCHDPYCIRPIRDINDSMFHLLLFLTNVFHYRTAHTTEPPTPKTHSKCDILEPHIATTTLFFDFMVIR
jgi:hypothetical protein